MSKTISVERNGLVTTFSIKLLLIEAVNEFKNEHPNSTSGDLQTVILANNILLKLLLEK